MKKYWGILLILGMILCALCACGQIYECYDCGKNTSKAYYTFEASKEQVMCEECAREYWIPLPYQNYLVQ